MIPAEGYLRISSHEVVSLRSMWEIKSEHTDGVIRRELVSRKFAPQTEQAAASVHPGAPYRGAVWSPDPKRFSKGGGGHMVGMEINLEVRSNLDAWPQ
jgi:hypothetical protein